MSSCDCEQRAQGEENLWEYPSPLIYSVALECCSEILFIIKKELLRWNEKKMSYFPFNSYLLWGENHFVNASNPQVSVPVIRTPYQQCPQVLTLASSCKCRAGKSWGDPGEGITAYACAVIKRSPAFLFLNINILFLSNTFQELVHSILRIVIRFSIL